MEFILEVSPLSINKAFQGRRFKSDDYIIFERDVCLSLPINHEDPPEGEVVVKYIYHIKNYGATDTGNLEKTLTDMLVKRKYLKDDRYIKTLIQTKERTKEGEHEFIEIFIDTYKNTLIK